MKRLPVDVSTFEIIRTEGYLYIDETRSIYDLITMGRYHFLARPRCFGKTVLISTLEELFSGNRDLFKGLWIDSSNYTWKQHPVISLDFSTIDSTLPKTLKKPLLLSSTIKRTTLA